MSPQQALPQPREGFFRTMWRLARQLFHEVTGAMFGAVAIACVSRALRAWSAHEPLWAVALAAAYAAMMAYFSLTSFLRSRRVV